MCQLWNTVPISSIQQNLNEQWLWLITSTINGTYGKKAREKEVGILSWILFQGKVITTEILHKKLPSSSLPSMCVLCATNCGSLALLFFHCSYATVCWEFLLHRLQAICLSSFLSFALQKLVSFGSSPLELYYQVFGSKEI